MHLPLLLLLACGVRDLVPRGPVSPPATPASPAVTYTGPSRAAAPFPPLQVFGVRYDFDLVVATDHPRWTMHELAHLPGLGWIAKDAEADGTQHLSADHPAMATLAPEIPLARRRVNLRVQEARDGRDFALQADYLSPEDEPVRIMAHGRTSQGWPGRRNTSTMGHSAGQVAAVLDLFARHELFSVQVWYGGLAARVRRVLGQPVAAAIAQTQAGFAACSLRLEPGEGGWTGFRPADPEEPWPTRVQEPWTQEGPYLVQRGPLNTFAWRFVDGGLAEVLVTQNGPAHEPTRESPTLRLNLSSPLPDLGRPFEGAQERAFTLSLDDQPPHGEGRMVARSGPEGATLDILPASPRWLAERPMRCEARFSEVGAVTLRCAMAEAP